MSPATTQCASPPEPKLAVDGGSSCLDLTGLEDGAHHAMKSMWVDSSPSSSSSSSMQSRPSAMAAARSYGGLLPLPDQVCGVAADTPAPFFHDHASFKQVAALHGGAYYGGTRHGTMAMEGGGSFMGGESSVLYGVPPLSESIAVEDQITIMASSNNPKNNTAETTTLSSNNGSNITDNNSNSNKNINISLVSNSVVYWEGHQQQQHMSRNVMGEWDLEELMKDVSSLPFLDFQVE